MQIETFNNSIIFNKLFDEIDIHKNIINKEYIF